MLQVILGENTAEARRQALLALGYKTDAEIAASTVAFYMVQTDDGKFRVNNADGSRVFSVYGPTGLMEGISCAFTGSVSAASFALPTALRCSRAFRTASALATPGDNAWRGSPTRTARRRSSH